MKKALLYIKKLAMKKDSKTFEPGKTTLNERRILHFILDEQSKDIEKISKRIELKRSSCQRNPRKTEKRIPTLGNRLKHNFFMFSEVNLNLKNRAFF